MSSSIKLPPYDQIDIIIKWFRERYSGEDVEMFVNYLISIMNVKKLHIIDFHVGQQIGTWKIKAPCGKNHYHPAFKPSLSPDVLIRLGVFGGTGIRGIETQIPIDWIIFGLLERKISPEDMFPCQTKNHYQINSIRYKNDNPLAFFQWYCNYYNGRREAGDEEMIELWVKKEKEFNTLIESKTPISLITRQYYLHWGLFVM